MTKNLIFLILFVASQVCFAQQNQAVFLKLETVSQKNPQSSAALFYVSQYFFFNQNFTDAIAQVDKAIAIDAQNADLFFFKGLNHEAQGEYEAALNSYDKSIAIEPSTEFQLRRAMLRYKLKKHVGALQDFKAILADYEDMRTLDKYVKDCKKNGANESKSVEDNVVKTKIAPENSKTFVENFIKSYENFGDSGEIYRAFLYFYTGNFATVKPIFEKLTNKYSFHEVLFFSAIILEIEEDVINASFLYQKATKKVQGLLLDAQFEQLTGFQTSAATIARLKNTQTDYENKLMELNKENIAQLKSIQDTEADLRGEMNSEKYTYLYSFEQPEVVGNRTVYQLIIEKKMGGKVMVARATVEQKEKDKWVVIINHGGLKKTGGLTWSVFPQDFLQATFTLDQNPSYRVEGDRMKNLRNRKLDLKTLSTLKPVNLTAYDALTFAARVYMVGFIVK